MKIAILLTGMMRTYRDTYKSLFESFPNADIYIETSDILGNLISKSSNQFTKEKVDIDHVKQIYNPVYINVENSNEWMKQNNDKYQKLWLQYNNLDSEINQYMFIHGLFAQYYKVYHGFSKIPDEYDLIVRARPDMKFLNPDQFKSIYIPQKNQILMKDFSTTKILDYLIAGRYREMKIYSEFFLNISDKIEEIKNIQVEVLLRHYLISNNFALLKFPFDFSVLRTGIEKIYSNSKQIKDRK